MKKEVTLLAKGGMCRIVLDVLSHSNSYHAKQICDDGHLGADPLHGLIPCEKTIAQYVNDCSVSDVFFNCIGNYHAMGMRIAYSVALRQKGCKSVNIIHPYSFISDTVAWGDGNLICPNVVLSTNVKTGSDNVFCTGTAIGHDCRIGNNVYLSPSVTLCGKVEIDDNVYIGPGTVIAACVHIGSRSIIGAGSVVLKDVKEGSIVYGNPAKMIRMNDLW